MGKVAASAGAIMRALYPDGRPEMEEYLDRCAEQQRQRAAAQHRSLVVVEEIQPRPAPRPIPCKKFRAKLQGESDRTRAKWEAARKNVATL